MAESLVFIYPFMARKWGITLALSLGNYLGLFASLVGIYHGPRHAWIMSYSLFPNPDIPYNAFADDMKPEIANSVWFTILTPEEILHKIAAYSLQKKYSSVLPDYKTFFHARLQPLLKNSSILGFQTDSHHETAYSKLETLRELIGWESSDLLVKIHCKAQKTAIGMSLVPAIIKHLTPRKERRLDKKWKYYLIVYDLFEHHKLNYQQINMIFKITCPKKPKNPENPPHYPIADIERYHLKAISYINKKKYQDYLYF